MIKLKWLITLLLISNPQWRNSENLKYDPGPGVMLLSTIPFLWLWLNLLPLSKWNCLIVSKLCSTGSKLQEKYISQVQGHSKIAPAFLPRFCEKIDRICHMQHYCTSLSSISCFCREGPEFCRLQDPELKEPICQNDQQVY